MKLESMEAFFTARVEEYDEHMLHNVEGCKEGYIKMAGLIPAGSARLLDLGCGTGLELDEIWKRFPDIAVTGIDLTQSMLDKLKEKHADKQLTLLCEDYFNVDFGVEAFDCAVSFETMHHFSHEKKIGLYRNLFAALASGGCYIECDYMVDTQEEEDHWYSENERLRKEQNIPADAFYHYDTPCTIQNQILMLREAGFAEVELVFRLGGTAMLVAKKCMHKKEDG